MSKLLLLANEFPYGSWEPYIETESDYYGDFEKVWICSLQLRDEHRKTKRNLKVDAEIIPIRYISRIQYFIESILTLLDSKLYKELAKLIKQKRLKCTTLVDLFVFLSRAHHEARVIDQAFKNTDKSNLVFYSYRFEYQPYVAILLKKKWNIDARIVCRAHGYDLYEERHRANYIPMRETILEAVNIVYPCSMAGVKYLQDRFPQYKEKVEVRFLGSKNHGLGLMPQRSEVFRIVSCSRVTKIKRVKRIVDGLALIKDIKIEWTHYGDGPLFDELKSYAALKLKNNINYIFKGDIRNSDLLDEYGKIPYDIFINVSTSEGIPVSIMEALSFGIPCIATDVGGTREILEDRTYSRLLHSCFSDEDLSETIREYCIMESKKYTSQRIAAREYWNTKFNADKNYLKFIEELR